MAESKNIESFIVEIGQALESILSSIWLFLNSQFALTLIGTLVAAFPWVVDLRWYWVSSRAIRDKMPFL
jgi:hypothetical protein